MNCKNCGAQIPSGGLFCVKCGTKAPHGCEACGKGLPDDAVFCPFCGHKSVGTAPFGNQTPPTQTARQPIEGNPYDQNAYGYPENRQPDYQGAQNGYGYRPAPRYVKPRTKEEKQKLAKRILTLTQAWLIAGIFALMFGLSFLPVYKMDSPMFDDLEGQLGVELRVDFSAIEFASALLSEKASANEVSTKLLEDLQKELTKKFGNIINSGRQPTEKEMEQIVKFMESYLNNCNLLKILTAEEMVASAPFSIYFFLIAMMLCGFAVMILSLIFAILAVIKAIYATIYPNYCSKNNLFVKAFAAIAGVVLFTTIIAVMRASDGTGTAFTGGMAAAFILSILGLGGIFAIDTVSKSTPRHLGAIITDCAAMIMVFVLALTSSSLVLGVKADYPVSHSGSYIESSYTAGIDLGSLLDCLDVQVGDGLVIIDKNGRPTSIANESSVSYARIVRAALTIKTEQQKGNYVSFESMPNYGISNLSREEYDFAYNMSSLEESQIVSIFSPQLILFYAEMSQTHNSIAVLFGATAKLLVLAYGAVLSLLLIKLLYALVSGKHKKESLLHILNLVFFFAATAITLAYVLMTNDALSQLRIDFVRLKIGFMSFFNVFLAIAALAGRWVLIKTLRNLRMPKLRPRTYAPQTANQPYGNAAGYTPYYNQNNQAGYPPQYAPNNQAGYPPQYAPNNQAGYPPQYAPNNQAGYPPQYAPIANAPNQTAENSVANKSDDENGETTEYVQENPDNETV